MEIIILFTHAYTWALRPFWALFQKHWPDQPVTAWGDRVEGEVPEGMSFRRVPCYSEGEWPWSHWFGNGVRSIMDALKPPIVGIFLPDHWLTGPVDVEGVGKLARWMDKKGNILRGNLTRGTCLDGRGRFIDSAEGLEIVNVPPTDIHCGLMGGVTFAPALWSRSLLRDVMEPRWSFHETEKVGTEAFARKWYPELYSVGTRPGLLDRAHGMSHLRPKVADLAGLCPEDQEIVKRTLPGDWSWIG